MDFSSNFDQSQVQILVKLVVAMFLGALLGLERELANKPAGLRTHMLVAGAAALLVVLAEFSVERFQADLGGTLVRSDPIRILEAVIAGISFLGAGTIIRSRQDGSVEGLTTAASMLFIAAVGTAVALDRYILAGGATILALLILRGLGYIEGWFETRRDRAEGEKPAT